MSPDPAQPEPLKGGNVSDGVVRVGDTVRRPAGAHTPAVHALLRHLRDAGFDGAPRPLGIDEQGREVLTFAAGVVPWPDRFDLLAPDAALVRVAQVIRRLHDAAASFRPPPDAQWQVLIPADRNELIVHHDLAPWNLVAGDRWVFIDWDTAAPGSRLWDISYALHGFVPLMAQREWRRRAAGHRMRVFVDAYGLDGAQRRELVPLLAPRARAMDDFLATSAEGGDGSRWVGVLAGVHSLDLRLDTPTRPPHGRETTAFPTWLGREGSCVRKSRIFPYTRSLPAQPCRGWAGSAAQLAR
ncbi:phosphotransferase [Natronosporangium hydrolyticum]|uniref:Phosphotransferase n=1 Tax=Natronosporangium hydrolyticum TaxID=2811111 RepID=A0A895YAX1_9ACTN|nr:phosphotransferase [Natronosporangium hydrolyticum]QSB12623.1 phosphotransferase [Natronosporangium hydrolyticum]